MIHLSSMLSLAFKMIDRLWEVPSEKCEGFAFLQYIKRTLHFVVSAPEMARLCNGVRMYATAGFHFSLL